MVSSLTGCSHTQHGDCSSGGCGNRRHCCGQLHHDSVHQLGLRLPGRPSYQTEAEKYPLPAAGQRGSVLLSTMQDNLDREESGGHVGELLSVDTWSPFSFCQVDLEEERLKKRAAALTSRQKIILYSLRVLMCFLAFGLIIAAFYGIFRTTIFSQVNDVKVE